MFGVYLLVYAFLKIPLAANDFYVTLRYASLAKKIGDVSWISFVCSLVGIFLQLLIGYYLVCRYQNVLNWIDRTPATETAQ
jgi:hypothetical protein